MKKTVYLFTIGLAVLFAACNNDKQSLNAGKDMILLSDSSYNNNAATDTGRAQATNQSKASNITGTHTGNRPGKQQAAPAGQQGSSSQAGNTAQGNAGNEGSASGAGNDNSGNTAGEKKGISKAAKGAIIGGVGGAVVGAVVSKKKGTGAVIGGAAGAAGGYIIGRKQDKKDGRVKN